MELLSGFGISLLVLAVAYVAKQASRCDGGLHITRNDLAAAASAGFFRMFWHSAVESDDDTAKEEPAEVPARPVRSWLART